MRTQASSPLSAVLTPRWTFKGPWGPLSAPLVVAGDRLIGLAGSTLFAVDTATGTLAGTSDTVRRQHWPRDLDFIYGGDTRIAAAGGRTYFTEGDLLRAVRTADGADAEGWPRIAIPDVASIFVSGGHLAVVHPDPRGAAQVSGFDAADGSCAFGPITIDDRTAGPVALGGGALFFVASHALHAVNTDFGDQRWSFTPDGDRLDGLEAPLVAGPVALVAGGSLQAVDLETGAERWRLAASSGGGVRWHTPAAYLPAGGASRGLAIASHSGGEVVAVALADGAVAWRARVASPGAPSVLGGVVYLTANGGRTLVRLHAATGTPAGEPFELGELDPDHPVAIGDGTLFLAGADGRIVARPFAGQTAAFFDGSASRIDVRPESAQFDFGTGDFTVEAWFRSSMGGEIVSAHPTAPGPDAHGFRLNLTPGGHLRVAVGSGGAVPNVARTGPTSAADGEWHHVALIRRDGEFVVLLDGLAMPLRLPDSAAGTLGVGGACGLTIGAFVPSAGAEAEAHFRGLIREVRMWDRALDPETVEANLRVELTGTEPRLRGLWRLDEVQAPGAAVQPENAVERHRARATFVNAASVPTGLAMDRSAFPYLLHEPRAQWPYAGTWAARGEEAFGGSPALSSDGVVAFATSGGGAGSGNAIYGVDAHSGKRVWAMDVSESASDPVADGAGFLVLTEEESLVRVDARTGETTQAAAFAGRLHDGGRVAVAPAVGAHHVAAAVGGSTVLVHDRTRPDAREVRVAGTPARLSFADPGLLVLCGDAGARRLDLVDPAAAAVVGGTAVSGDAFCAVGSSVFCVRNGAVVKLEAPRLGGALERSAPLEGGVTGMAASPHDDVLVVATGAGEVHGLTLGRLAPRWRVKLPAGDGGDVGAVNPPVLDGAGRIACTTTGGTAAFLDAGTGALMGLYALPRGAVGTPLVHAGTLYTGCAEAPESEDRDGALHSVVFGETVALRLNLDARGAPVPGGAQHAVVDAHGSACSLHLLNVRESCVEAWVNLPPGGGGGGILGICPGQESGFGLDLWVDADGTLHYASRVRTGGAWSGEHVRAPAGIADGRWHHVAACRAPDGVALYVDGHPAPLSAGPPVEPPARTADGLRAYVGATAGDGLAPTRPLCGMIAEVRVWDTYLEPSEIVSRMHVKLRGSEPDLAAYWNFDREAVHDSAAQGHDGALAEPPAHPVWWVADLPFTLPSYPFLQSTAVLTSGEEEPGGRFELTLKVCSADGRGMPRQPMRVWYARHAPDDPPSVLVQGRSVAAVDGASETAVHAFEGRTAADGTLTLTIETPLAGHGPALDVWTGFMPANERFHVNVLLDTQALAKATPPSLTAQARLIQDYHYTTGGAVDHTRDRSTWRVVLHAAEPDGRPRPGEPISLWTSATAEVEVGGAHVLLTPFNQAAFTADDAGELVVVMAAETLTPPSLLARAGFMHRNDRVVVSPGQEAHATLSRIGAEELTEPRVANWRPGAREQPLLRSEYHGTAGDVARAVRQVASSVSSDPAQASLRRAALRGRAPTPAGARRALLRATAADAMEQPRRVPAADAVVLRRARPGRPRPAAADPRALRRSLGGATGFVLERHEGGVTYTALATRAEALRAMGPPTPAPLPHALGNIFDDAWGVIKDLSRSAYDGARRIVVIVEDAVQVAVTTVANGIEKVTKIVVHTVEQAIDAVVGFFEQILVRLKDLVEFLRVIFDWGAILRTHDVLHDTFRAVFDASAKTVRSAGVITEAVRHVAGGGAPEPGGPDASLADLARGPSGPGSRVLAAANGVQGRAMMQKSAAPPRSIGSAARAVPALPGVPGSDALDAVLLELPGLAAHLIDSSPADAAARMVEVLRGAAGRRLDEMERTLAAAVDGVAGTLAWFLQVLDAEIDIPFVSELYRWITGRRLTLLDAACLALAVPVNVAYAALTLAQGGARRFADDASGLARDVRAAAGLAPARLRGDAWREGVPAPGGVGAGGPGPREAAEIITVVAWAFAAGADAWADATYLESALNGAVPSTVFRQAVQGVGGIVSLALKNFSTFPAYEARIRAVAGQDAGRFLPPYREVVYTVYAGQTLLRALKIASAVATVRRAAGAGQSAGFDVDGYDYGVLRVCAVAGLGLIAYQGLGMAERIPELKRFGNADVTSQYVSFAVRDLLGTVPLLFEWMYTRQGMRWVTTRDPWGYGRTYSTVNTLRATCSAAAIAAHGTAVWIYGQSEVGG
jgi:outer membrane protein assembly factor BamB